MPDLTTDKTFLNSFGYTIYQDGGVVNARNNKTGAVTTNANIDPLITTILASGDPTVEVQTGTYILSAGFTGWDMVSDAYVFFHRGCWIYIPQGYTGDVWKFSSGSVDIFGAKLIGGLFIETATAANDWNFVAIKPTAGKGVVMCQVKDNVVWRAKRVIHINTTDLSWGSDNVFENIESECCEYFTEFAHTGTWTPDASGLHQNMFNHCFLQSSSASGGNPLTLGGIINIMGDGNIFTNCNIWDLGSRNPSAPTATIHANARATEIIGGLMAYQLFTDSGTKTRVRDRHTGYLAVSTTPVTLYATDYQMIKVDASGGARTVNLPAASGNSGVFLTIIKSDSSANAVTIDGNASETINGATTFLLTVQYQSVVLRCDGSNWFTQPNSSERTGKAVASGNGSNTAFTIAHGLGSTPSNVFVDCSSHAIARTYTTDSTNISVTFSSAPSSGTNNVVIYWRAVA